ncbi:MAG: A/G-specific adenine glycosylase [Aequorivita sp.]|nr:A/G-specific adenine glycosylase [Aequorivita sp.]|tara:strand:- start:74551 stop:75615 length:1065 start_codon:yes stop_codon:yes gene_type:complete
MPKTTPILYNKLISWYLKNKRDLPWRNSSNPYHIWLSEIILQQTRVTQGLPYYLKFLEAYPTVQDLANASEDEILKTWQGLGYYSRARNLHATAKKVANELNGKFPNNYTNLIKLKGVGDYTASAIASIAFNQPNAVVDGNVYRVLSRIIGISTPINSTAGRKEFKLLAQQLINKDKPGTANQAIMEFGARFCVPQNPDCIKCIFNESCYAFQHKKVAQLPVKLKQKPIKKRFFNYMVILSENNKTLLQQRLSKGIWQKLFEFPLIETQKDVTTSELEKLPQFKNFAKGKTIENITLYNDKPIIHKLSHQHLYTKFWIVYLNNSLIESIPISDVNNYAVPTLVANFVSEFFENY